MRYFIGHDLGTGGDKAVLVDETGALRADHVEGYPLHHPRPGWAEQRAADWWSAVCSCTNALIEKSGVSPGNIAGLGFAGQMLSLVAFGADGRLTREPIIWMDARAEEQAQRMTRRLGGAGVLQWIAGGVPTGKDLVAKIAWIEEHEPGTFRDTAAFTDATGYLVARATGRVRMDPTAAGATGIFDAKKRRWSRLLARLVSFPLQKMPQVVASTSIAGELAGDAAQELGLPAGLPVAMGMADIPSAAVGSGAVRPGDAHLYLGTSSWIGVSVAAPKSVPSAGIASVPSAGMRGCLMIGESETAGACRDWFERHLGAGVAGAALDAMAAGAAPGAGGLLFLPWMYGERSPVPDTRVRGAFVNLSLEHGRAELMRAVYEGIALNLRWILDACASVAEPCPVVRAIGGGAQSDTWLRIIADVTGRRVERVAHPQQAGAVGSALAAAIATGALGSVESARAAIRIDRAYDPDPSLAALYARAYSVFRELYAPLSRAGRGMAP